MYRIDENIEGIVIRLNDDGTKSYIPMVEGNADYARYLRWVEDPEADESGTL